MVDETKASPEEGLEEEENEKKVVSKDEAKQAAALERMSGGQDNASNVDASKARNAIGLLNTQTQLAGTMSSAIKIDAANVKLLVEELEVITSLYNFVCWNLGARLHSEL